MDPSLLEILCCPLAGKPLHIGSSDEVVHFPGACKPLLVREDGQVAYPVVDGIPRVVPGAAIERLQSGIRCKANRIGAGAGRPTG